MRSYVVAAFVFAMLSGSTPALAVPTGLLKSPAAFPGAGAPSLAASRRSIDNSYNHDGGDNNVIEGTGVNAPIVSPSYNDRLGKRRAYDVYRHEGGDNSLIRNAPISVPIIGTTGDGGAKNIYQRTVYEQDGGDDNLVRNAPILIPIIGTTGDGGAKNIYGRTVYEEDGGDDNLVRNAPIAIPIVGTTGHGGAEDYHYRRNVYEQDGGDDNLVRNAPIAVPIVGSTGHGGLEDYHYRRAARSVDRNYVHDGGDNSALDGPVVAVPVVGSDRKYRSGRPHRGERTDVYQNGGKNSIVKTGSLAVPIVSHETRAVRGWKRDETVYHDHEETVQRNDDYDGDNGDGLPVFVAGAAAGFAGQNNDDASGDRYKRDETVTRHDETVHRYDDYDDDNGDGSLFPAPFAAAAAGFADKNSDYASGNRNKRDDTVYHHDETVYDEDSDNGDETVVYRYKSSGYASGNHVKRDETVYHHDETVYGDDNGDATVVHHYNSNDNSGPIAKADVPIQVPILGAATTDNAGSASKERRNVLKRSYGYDRDIDTSDETSPDPGNGLIAAKVPIQVPILGAATTDESKSSSKRKRDCVSDAERTYYRNDCYGTYVNQDENSKTVVRQYDARPTETVVHEYDARPTETVYAGPRPTNYRYVDDHEQKGVAGTILS